MHHYFFKHIFLKRILAVLCFSVILSLHIYGDEGIKLPDLIVTGSKTGGYHARDIYLLTPVDFTPMVPLTVDEVLAGLPYLEIQKRGPSGAQQDISINGAGFNQTLIMLDGIPVADPQTGHFSMNVPIPVGSIGRIEYIAGHGSAVHGSGAVGGIINIVPRTVCENDLTLYTGSYNTLGTGLTVSTSGGEFSNSLSMMYRRTGNYHPATDFRDITFFYTASYKLLRIHAGFSDKEFGAYDFYTPGWDMPSREKNRVFIFSGSTDFKINMISINPVLQWRRHNDDFILDGDNPDFYRNTHMNDVLETQLNLKSGNLAAGTSMITEFLESDSLGDRNRQSCSLYAETTFKPWNIFLFTTGLRYNDIIMPRISGSYSAGIIRFRSSWGKSYRLPTMTELYYISPANTGDPHLDAEISINWETGCDLFLSEYFKLKTTYVWRKTDDLIDWVSDTETGPWKAANTGSTDTEALNTAVQYKNFPFSISINHSYTILHKNTDYFSKYALDYPRHKFKLSFTTHISRLYHINVSSIMRLPSLTDSRNSYKVNISLRYKIAGTQFFIKADNIFDLYYADFEYIPRPGRWITGGVDISF